MTQDFIIKKQEEKNIELDNKYCEDRKDFIISNLTPEQEDTLMTIHADGYMGTDDDMAESYEKWLAGLTVMDLESYLEM